MVETSKEIVHQLMAQTSEHYTLLGKMLTNADFGNAGVYIALLAQGVKELKAETKRAEQQKSRFRLEAIKRAILVYMQGNDFVSVQKLAEEASVITSTLQN